MAFCEAMCHACFSSFTVRQQKKTLGGVHDVSCSSTVCWHNDTVSFELNPTVYDALGIWLPLTVSLGQDIADKQ